MSRSNTPPYTQSTRPPSAENASSKAEGRESIECMRYNSFFPHGTWSLRQAELLDRVHGFDAKEEQESFLRSQGILSAP